MFRNALNGYVRKAFDYLKIENDDQEETNNSSQLTNRRHTSESYETGRDPNNHKDVNNNHIAKIVRERRQTSIQVGAGGDSWRFRDRQKQSRAQHPLIDEYDWFRPFRSQAGDDEVSDVIDSPNNHDLNIKFDSYYDYLTKFYAANMKNQPRTLDEYFAGNEKDFDLPEPDATQQQLQACRLFQKAYYREIIKGEQVAVPSWRMKERMKTVSAALVLCLNIGVDPPDIVKPPHCSKLECWINQMQATPQKALETIGNELMKQYERWQPRARYKHSLDPTTEDVKKLCISLRRNAKEDRVLFHYNGHGVPKPTANGEIWVFNKEFTQYIPLSLYEVQNWMGVPSLYVWDCSSAGLIVQNFLQFEEERENEILQRTETVLNGTGSPRNSQIINDGTSGSVPKLRDSIHLAACSANEILPMQSPDLPYDIFTACLTTPIKAALYWYVSQRMGGGSGVGQQAGPQVKQMIPGLTLDMLDRIPGQINDRRTMMGELNWIFTAITDTIAWNVLDSDMFQKLFRQDLLVASLFRNFLLAERIMKSLDCNPVSHPPLPSTHEHPLWQAWDLALDMCISQLPGMLAGASDPNQPTREFISCGFFTEQIDIFDAWLKYNVNSSSCPEQLPVVLQVLLSVHHRLKALELLAKFIDMGPWAVSAALSVGIFPYVLKLLSTQPKELRSLLTFIWAKILAVDKSCQTELVKDQGHAYFIHILPEQDVPPIQKVYSAFVLSCLVDNYPTGQESAKQNHLIAICAYLLSDKQSRDYESPLLRQWVCICLGLSWQNYPEARWEGVRSNAHQSLIRLVNDPVAEVRAAAIFALGTYIGCGQGNEATIEHTNKIHSEIVSALIKEYDMVYIVRKELIVALFNYINQFINQQQTNGSQIVPNNDLTRHSSSSSLHTTNPGPNSTEKNPNIPKSQSTSTLSRSSSSGIGLNQQQSQQLERINETKPANQTIVQSPSNSTSDYSSGGSSSSGASNPSIKPTTQPISTPSSLLANNSVNSLFVRVWNLIIDMESDPHPEVAELAQRVFNYFMDQLSLFDASKQKLISDLIKLKQVRATPSNTIPEKGHHGISTEFVPWCSKYFLKPLLSARTNQQGEILETCTKVDLYSAEILDQHCKLLYNQKKRKNPPVWQEAREMDELCQIKHPSLPIYIKFHPSEEHLMFVVDRDSQISVYETRNRTKSLQFSLHKYQNHMINTRKGLLVTSFKIVNAQHEPILLVGTDDYVVRFFRPDLVGFKTNNTQLLTAFNAINEASKIPSTKDSGFILEWDEQRELLMCGGDTNFIRVWDMNRELYKDYPTEVNSGITSMATSDQYTVAGFGNGSLRLFDFRCPTASQSSFVRGRTQPSFYQHESYVLKVKFNKTNTHRLVSAGVYGGINVFDMRTLKSELNAPFNREFITALECHPFSDLIAVGNGTDQNQSIKIYDYRGRELSQIKHHDGFMGKRISTVSCIDWSCFKNDIVFGGNDNNLTIFTCRDINVG